MNAGSFQASHRVHAYCVLHHTNYRENKEKAMHMNAGTLSQKSAQDALRQSISILDPLKGIWYQKCVVEDTSFVVYTGRGTRYPHATSVWAVLEIDCDDVDNEEDLLTQCAGQLALQPKVHWYTAEMAAKHIEFLHTLLQPGFSVKETLAKLPADASSVLLVINGYIR